MRYFLLSILLLALPAAASAGSNTEAVQAGAVALDFMNGYVTATSRSGAVAGLKWIEKNPVVTNHFKMALARLYAEALKNDPELGYGADAVIGGQDCPESFQIKSCNAAGGNARVVLIGPRDFPMQVKVALVKVDGHWLVNGAGDLVH